MDDVEQAKRDKELYDSFPPMRAGHNIPPSNIKFSVELATILGAWLKEHPVVETEEVARSGKLLVDRTKLCLQDMEDERKGRTAPLNEQIKSINDEYRSPRAILDTILFELKDRLDAWIKKEEQIRLAAAEEARKRAENAAQIARDAENREREAIADAKSGVETDIVSLTRDADTTFAAFKRAEREAARAERDTDYKLRGGYKPAISPRNKKTPVVTDPTAAFTDISFKIGWSDDLLKALVKEAREFYRVCGRWPNGITLQEERKL